MTTPVLVFFSFDSGYSLLTAAEMQLTDVDPDAVGPAGSAASGRFHRDVVIEATLHVKRIPQKLEQLEKDAAFMLAKAYLKRPSMPMHVAREVAMAALVLPLETKNPVKKVIDELQRHRGTDKLKLLRCLWSAGQLFIYQRRGIMLSLL